MPLNPAITTRVNITVSSILKTFNDVIGLSFDYYKGMVNIVDSTEGSFYFGLTALTTVTYTIVGTTTTVTIS